MLRTLRSILALAVIGSPSLLQAQGGGVSVWSMHGTLPDTVQKAARGMLSTIDLRMTMATDGQRVSLLIAPGPEMIAASLTTDLSTVRMQVVASSTDDTVHIGVVLPPDIAAMMGGGIGFRLDLPLTADFIKGLAADSMIEAMTMKADSLNSDATKPDFHNTGRSDIVAGVPCEIWTVTGGTDTSDTMEMCLAAKPPAMQAMSNAMGTRFVPITSAFEKLGSERENPFGDRNLMAVRFRMLGDADFTFELVSLSKDAPAATFFELPPGLEPFPMEMLQGMTGAVGQSTGT